ncbi:MAG: hypothetical protein RL115_2001 [Bacteroidota bacterium]|jgi:hypothetical protein
MEKEALISVRLNMHEVVWIKPGKELAVRGQMFDIASYTIVGGVLYANGLFDEEEQALNDSVNRKMRNAINEDAHLFQQMFQLIPNSYPYQSVVTSFCMPALSIPNGFGKNDRLATLSVSVLTPPPKC